MAESETVTCRAWRWGIQISKVKFRLPSGSTSLPSPDAWREVAYDVLYRYSIVKPQNIQIWNEWVCLRSGNIGEGEWNARKRKRRTSPHMHCPALQLVLEVKSKAPKYYLTLFDISTLAIDLILDTSSCFVWEKSCTTEVQNY